jgi:cysteinyl-tRNA synthetase
LVYAINTAVKNGASSEFAGKCFELMDELTRVLGILRAGANAGETVEAEIAALIQEREEARKSKNFARADEIREILRRKGIILNDTPQGVQIARE